MKNIGGIPYQLNTFITVISELKKWGSRIKINKLNYDVNTKMVVIISISKIYYVFSKII